MKHYEIKDDFTTIVEEYKSFNDFVNVQNERPAVWVNPENDGKLYREVKGRRDWHQCESFEEAQEYLIHGYEQNVNQMVAKVGVLQKHGTRTKTQRYVDCVGYAPIVPNAILGLPNSMMNSKKKAIKSKVVTILYCPEVSWSVSSQEVLDFGCKFMNCVMNLEKNGYRVRIDFVNVFTTASDGKRQYILRIPVKNENNPINIKRLSFPLTNVGMQRFLCFDWFEHLPNSRYIQSLGAPLNKSTQSEKKNFNKLLKDNEFLITYGDDVEQIFSQIK